MVRVALIPKPGQTWPQFMDELIIQEGDADSATAAPNPGLPRDDGQPHLDAQGQPQNNSGYRIPVAPTTPAGAPPDGSGAPTMEIFDPNGVLTGTVTQMSGNVSQEDGTGFQFVDLRPCAPV